VREIALSPPEAEEGKGEQLYFMSREK